MEEQQFDWEAFINKFDPPKEDKVTLFTKDHNKEFDRLQTEAVTAFGEGDDKKARKLIKEAGKLRDEMEEGQITFTLRPLDPDVWRGLVRREVQGEDVRYEQMAKQIVEPVMSSLQWQTFARRVGARRFDTLYGACVAQMTEGVGALPDFLPGVWEGIHKDQNS